MSPLGHTAGRVSQTTGNGKDRKKKAKKIQNKPQTLTCQFSVKVNTARSGRKGQIGWRERGRVSVALVSNPVTAGDDKSPLLGEVKKWRLDLGLL